MKLWVKIFLCNLLIIACLGITILLTIKTVVTMSMRTELSRHGLSIARNLSERIADPVLLDDVYQTEEAILSVLNSEEEIEYIFVRGKRGEVFAHSFSDGYPLNLLSWNPTTDIPFSIQLLDTEVGYIRDIAVRIFEGMPLELHLGLKETRIETALMSLRNVIVASSAIVILIAALLSCLFAQYITRPLSKLVDLTHSLAKGEFGKQVDISSSDEVGDLAKTFDNLSQELKRYREKMEESYRQMLRAEKLSALGRLSAGLAHEIRNPLTSIKVLFQAFREDLALTREDMEVVLAETNQMETILKRFLAFSRVEEAKLTDADINETLRQVLQLSRYQQRSQSIRTETDFGKLPLIKVDQTMLEQVLLNLVINSIEAMPDGGILTITSQTANQRIRVTIGDTGNGIADELHDKIFDPFFTTKDEGTGLGLSIVYNIVRFFRGSIDFSSDAAGTTFTLEFPVAGKLQVQTLEHIIKERRLEPVHDSSAAKACHE